jgi:uncharacterized protein (TIGR02265 family)
VGFPVFTLSSRIEGDLDIDEQARNIPLDFVVKGAFFARLRERAGKKFDAILQTLAHPPRFGRYMPFSDYPQADYLRVAAAATRAVHPNLPFREGLRRVAREDFKIFSETTLGRVVLAAAGDARSAMLATAKIYTKLAGGPWEVRARDHAPGVVRLEFEPHPGAWEYQLGQIEGLVLHFGGHPRIGVEVLEGGHVIFDVHHGGAA